MDRPTLTQPVAEEREFPKTFTSGSVLLDLVCGGGWGIARVVNIVGDKSAGKSLLAIEACANFAQLFDPQDIRYNETESAFDRDYAESIGFPEGITFTGDEEENADDRHGSRTIEALDADLGAFLADRIGKGKPCLYVVDSFDAISDNAELKQEMGTATYGTAKAKLSSEMFRRRIGDIEKAMCTLIIISQIRDKIGVTFGETKTRSGGRALDFYASQIVWLAEIKKLDRTVSGVKRITGVRVLANNKKNKIGKPFRRAEISIFFNYGIDDAVSNADWLKDNNLGAGAPALSLAVAKYSDAIRAAKDARDLDRYNELRDELAKAVKLRWNEIEDALEPSFGKYNPPVARAS